MPVSYPQHLAEVWHKAPSKFMPSDKKPALICQPLYYAWLLNDLSIGLTIFIFSSHLCHSLGNDPSYTLASPFLDLFTSDDLQLATLEVKHLTLSSPLNLGLKPLTSRPPHLCLATACNAPIPVALSLLSSSVISVFHFLLGPA